MDGGIYTRERCHKCGRVLQHDGGRKGCFCPDHPQVKAHTLAVKFPGGIYHRFKSYDSACQYLNYLRHEKGVRKKRFNPDDYRSIRPNSIGGLKDKYLNKKKSLASYRKIEHALELAQNYFGPRNVREINGADIEDYLYAIPDISEKTRRNHSDYLRNFWKWVLSRGVITMAEMPVFPEIPYELGYRKITDWETQRTVIDKLREICPNPKVHLAIDMLATYTAIRPEDIRRVTEGSLDSNGWLTLVNPTKLKNSRKHIHLHPDHQVQWRSLQAAFPALPDALFFRGQRTGKVFGVNHLYKWWCRACAEVGLKGVPLYPGTKHTTATETAKLLGSDKALSASGLTNKAFERYCHVENDDNYDVVRAIRVKQMGKVIAMKRKKEEG